MNPIQDLIDMAEREGANIAQLLSAAFNRGYNEGANHKKTEAIKLLTEDL